MRPEYAMAVLMVAAVIVALLHEVEHDDYDD